MISCSTQKVLKTDTQQDIDLSGRWNTTDAEIATNELFNSFTTSSWLKEYQAKNDLKPRIEILEFDGNFRNGGEQLEKYFKQYAKSASSVELIENRSEKMPEFLLRGKITAEEFVTENDNYIDYIIVAELIDIQKNVLWEDKTIVKKYLKD